MWVKCKICAENTYVSPTQENDASLYICPACREKARRQAKARRDRLVMIVTALVLIGPLIYLTAQGVQSIQFCWGGLLMLGAAFYFTRRGQTRT